MTRRRSTRWETVREGDYVTAVYSQHDGITRSCRGRVARIVRNGQRIHMYTKESGVVALFDIGDAPRFYIDDAVTVNPEPLFEV